MKTIKISINKLTSILNSNIDKWGSTDWFLDITENGKLEFNHNTYDRGAELLSMYNLENWDNEEKENVPFEEFPTDWLPDLEEIERSINEYKSIDEHINIEWCK